ncbi:MAG: isopeptide-forming domain-containing fimbrial protein [Anaerococcus vaginalis]|uniref:isopeptide-forming domain-containing fimbrial protein n=1 Tax=Anaerococcus vaginalis TaxID=33037 RepID=UPI002914E8A5|nr:isopeptide-forming domain-containing fimbrial protein [Anaerococcus vaginalis]MDU7650453.1 isopeptide-forming domain-containing fimbrial protein [Anaerococcus vaginalis]
MKHKILSFLTAFAMVFGIVAAPFVNASAEGEQTTKTVTVHKILQTKANLDAKKEGKDIFPGTEGINGHKYDGNAINDLAGYFGTGSKDIGGVYFVWTNEQDQVIDTNGKALNPEIKVVNNKLPKGTTKANLEEKNALAGMTEDNKGYKFTTSGLKAGKYKIYEIHSLSSYTNGDKTLTEMKAVPVVINLPLNDVVDAHVYPKNIEEKPEIDKNFAKDNDLTEAVEEGKDLLKVGADYKNYQAKKATAKAEIGKEIPYEVKTKIPAQSKYEILKWTDSMTDGLTFKKDSLKVTADNGITFDENDYDVIADDHGFTLRFTQAGLDKVQNKENVTNITLTYSAIVNADAVIDQEEINDVKFDYGNKPGEEVKPTETQPKNKEIKVEKSWAVDGKAVTEADKTVTAVFTLQVKDGENWKDVDTYTSTMAENFTHTFTGLDDTKTYRVVERVSGYEPKYVTTTEAGKVEIRNNKDSENPKPLDPTEPKVVIGGRKFVKADEGTGARLENAEFKIKNAEGKFLKDKAGKDIQKAIAEYKAADKAYKDAVAKLTQNDGVINYPDGVTADSIKTLREDRDKKYVEAQLTYEWVDGADNASVFKSNAKGQLEVIGLEYADNYEIVETKAPAGYALPSNPTKKFNVNKGSYSADAEGVVYEGTENVVDKADGADAMRINNKKVTIPQTGGIGSIIFVVAGLMIMGLAAYKMKANKEQA